MKCIKAVERKWIKRKGFNVDKWDWLIELDKDCIYILNKYKIILNDDFYKLYTSEHHWDWRYLNRRVLELKDLIGYELHPIKLKKFR